jgi:O-antigen/teichoic acid export membrane protein
MNEIITIKKNSFFSLLSISSRLISNVILFWILARFFGPTTFGKFSYAHALANTFLLFADFGFDLLITTEVAKNRTSAAQIFQQYFWIKFSLAIISLISMFLFVIIRGGGIESVIIGTLFAFYMLFNTITNYFVASFKGLERLDCDAKVSLLMNIFLFISVVLLFLLSHNIYLIAGTYVFSRILGFLYSIRISHYILPDISYKLEFDHVGESLRKSFLFGVLILANGFLFQLDTLLLGIFKGDYDVGVYQAVKYLLLVPFIIPNIISNALLPTLARTYKESYENWISINRTFFKIVFWLSLPISLILFLYPGQIIELVYSAKKYALAIPILRLFSIILFLRNCSDYLGLMLITSGRQRILVYTSLVSILLGIICSSLFIPKYGAYGTGIVYLIITIFVILVNILFNIKVLLSHIINSGYFILLILSATISLAVQQYFHIKPLIGVPVILIFFISSAIFFFTKNEKEEFLSLKKYLILKKNK